MSIWPLVTLGFVIYWLIRLSGADGSLQKHWRNYIRAVGNISVEEE